MCASNPDGHLLHWIASPGNCRTLAMTLLHVSFLPIELTLTIKSLAVCCASRIKFQKSDCKALFYPANCHRTEGSRRPDNRNFCVTDGAKIHKRDRLPGDTPAAKHQATNSRTCYLLPMPR
jgi:hypothetical protein